MTLPTATQPKRPVATEIPIDAIREAAKSHPMVAARIMRTNGSGQWASLPGMPFAFDTIKVVEIDAWLENYSGGGLYRVECFSPQSMSEAIESIPPFMIRVEGDPKVVVRPGRTPAAGGSGFQAQAERPWNPTTGAPAINPRDLASMPSDAIALEQVHSLRDEIAQERARREQERKDAADKEAAHRRELDALREKLTESDKNRQVAALEAKLEMLTKLPPAQPKFDWSAAIPMVSALVPLGVALIESGKARSADATTQAQRAADKNQEMMLSLMTANKGEDPFAKLLTVIATVIPAAVPLIKTFLEQRSPDKMAELVSTMADNNLQQMSMMKTFLDPLLENSESPLVGFLQQGLHTLVETAKHMVSTTAQQGPSGPRQVQGPATKVMPRTAAPSGEDMAAVEKTASYFVQLIMSAPNIDPALKTPEWQALFMAMHRFDDAAETAKAISNHLVGQLNNGTLPPFLMPIFQENGPAPSTVLGGLIMGLPVGQMDPAYAQAMLAEFDALFSESPAESDVA